MELEGFQKYEIKEGEFDRALLISVTIEKTTKKNIYGLVGIKN